MAITPLPRYGADRLAAMGPKQLVAALTGDEDRAPRELMDACARRGDVMLAHLAAVVDDDRPWDDLARGEWWFRLHAAMILGLMQEAGAGELLVGLMHRIADEGDDDLQDWLAGYWPALFRNKPNSVLAALRELAVDDAHGWYIRCQAVESVIEFEHHQAAGRFDAALDWAAAIAADEEEDWDMRCVVGGTLLDYAVPRHRPLLEALARRQGTAALTLFAIDDVAHAYEGDEDNPRERFADPWTAFYSADAIAGRQERWAKEAHEEAVRVAREAAADLGVAGDGEDADTLDSYDDFATGALVEPAHSAPEPGRNDPCACGSGKKYKKCCLVAATNVPADELAWRRLRYALNEHRPTLVRFARRAYGESVLDEAWDDFSADELGPFDDQGPHALAFVPWFCNLWSPVAGRTLVGDTTLYGVPPAAAYLERAKHVEPLFREHLESCLTAPFTMFELLKVTPGVGIRLRDLFTGAEHDVSERTGSHTMRAGDLIAGQVGRAGGTAIIEACSGFVISPIQKLAVLDARRLLFPGGPPDAGALRARHGDIVALYRRIARVVLDPQMPKMVNTDGEPLSLRRVVFDVPSAQDAFDALKHLASGGDDAELLHDAERDAAGTLRAVRFPWLRADPSTEVLSGNTVLGWLEIRAQRLAVCVNSEAREQRVRGLVTEALGDRARFLLTETESTERAWTDARTGSRPSASRAQIGRETERLAAIPEIARAMMELIAKQYERWPDEHLPALDGRTPREAVKNAEGREAVAAIIAEIERNGVRQVPPLDPAVVIRMREELGLRRR